MTTFNEDDVRRWQERNEIHVAILHETIGKDDLREGRQLTQLARVHEYLALTAIARGEHGKARGHFGASGEAWANVFERADRGEAIDESLTAVVPLGAFLLAHAGTERAIERLVRATARVAEERSKANAAHYLGVLLRTLSVGDVGEAQALLGVAPKMAKHQEGALRAVRAIVNSDEDALAAALKEEVDFWQKTIRREKLQRLPDAVCYDHGLGWIALAERIWQRRVELHVEHSPTEVLRAPAEEIEVGV